MTRDNHLIEAAAKEVVGDRLGPSKHLRKLSVSHTIFSDFMEFCTTAITLKT